jgi:hypothetical protein
MRYSSGFGKSRTLPRYVMSSVRGSCPTWRCSYVTFFGDVPVGWPKKHARAVLDARIALSDVLIQINTVYPTVEEYELGSTKQLVT